MKAILASLAVLLAANAALGAVPDANPTVKIEQGTLQGGRGGRWRPCVQGHSVCAASSGPESMAPARSGQRLERCA